MSKKRKKQGVAAACERCGYIAKTQVRLRTTESYQNALGRTSLPRPDRIRPMTPDAAFECAVQAGIFDEQGNLMPRYR